MPARSVTSSKTIGSGAGGAAGSGRGSGSLRAEGRQVARESCRDRQAGLNAAYRFKTVHVQRPALTGSDRP